VTAVLGASDDSSGVSFSAAALAGDCPPPLPFFRRRLRFGFSGPDPPPEVAGSGSGQSLRAAAGLSAAGLSAAVDGNSGNLAAGSLLALLSASGLAGLADFFGRGFEIRRARGSALSAPVLAGVEGASLMNFAQSKPAQCAGVEHNSMTIAPQTRGNELCPLWESTTPMTRLGRARTFAYLCSSPFLGSQKFRMSSAFRESVVLGFAALLLPSLPIDQRSKSGLTVELLVAPVALIALR